MKNYKIMLKYETRNKKLSEIVKIGEIINLF